MKKIILIMVLATALCFAVAQNSWAVKITYVSGEIYASSTTNIDGTISTTSSQGFAASGNNTQNDLVLGVGAFAFASGSKQNGTVGLVDTVRFNLGTTTDVSSLLPKGSDAHDYSATSIVRSGPGGVTPDDNMIRFRFDAQPGDSNNIILNAQSTIDGVLKSVGLQGGEASITFDFAVFATDDLLNPVIEFHSQQFNDNLASDPLAGSLGSMTDNTTFMIGDEMLVFFEQKAYSHAAYNPSDPFTQFLEGFNLPAGGGASAFGVQSSTDLFSLSLTATAVPEPSTIILIGIGLSGLGIAGFRKRRRNKKNS